MPGSVGGGAYDSPRMRDVPTPPDERATLDLVERMRAGDGEAWREAYGRYRDEMLLSIRVRMGPRLRAAVQSEDILQSVVFEAFQAMPRFVDRGPGSLRGYLERLLLQKLRGRARRLSTRKRAGGEPLTDTLAEHAVAPAVVSYADPRYERLERALARLPDDMRDVIVMRRLEGLSIDETASRLDRSAAATLKLHARAMARLTLLMRDAGA